MPNVNAPNGFHPTMRNDGGGETKFKVFSKEAATGTALFKNDLVTRLTTGFISSAITPGTTPIQGVTMQHGAASTLTEHSVAVSSDAVYEAQMSLAYAFADAGLNANALMTAGDAGTKQSAHAVNSTGVAVTATLDLRIDGLVPSVNNEIGDYARVLVRINRHQRIAGSVGI